MFKNLFKRRKPAPFEPAAPLTPTSTEPRTSAPVAVGQKGKSLEAFREGWDDKWESSHEVIEGNGGDTDWGAWTEAVKEEDNGFAPTDPLPLGPR